MDLHKLDQKDSREILTSSAWNALIHPPVGEEEEGEGEELPSTVDMDAIKGAPATPLTAPPTPWSVAEHGNAQVIESEESSSEDEDDDSDNSTRSSSASDSDESGSDSCSYSTSSSSRSSSSSSRTAPSVRSSPIRQTFAVSKSLEGSLKLKISALKVASSEKSPNNVMPSPKTEETPSVVSDEVPPPAVEVNNAQATKTTEKCEDISSKRLEAKDIKKPITAKAALTVRARRSQSEKLKDPPPVPVAKKLAVKLSKNEVVPKDVPTKGKTDALQKKAVDAARNSVSPPKKKISEVSKLRSVRRKPQASSGSSVNSNSVAASSVGRHGRAAASSASSRSDSTTPTPECSESEEGDVGADAHITQLAHQLGNMAPEEPAHAPEPTVALPNMTEHLQVINQEDLAAILPDVVTTETSAGFDGFEDVSSESGKAEKKDAAGQDSGSDVELPDQIVSEAIKRIHVDSEDVDNSDTDKDAVKSTKSTPTKLASKQVDDSSSGSDEASSPMYSSSLLQQFVEKTEILSAQCERLINAGRSRKLLSAASASESRSKKPTSAASVSESKSKRHKAARAKREAAAAAVAVETAAPMPDLESYRLDCSLSNVSPDSGIQSVPGSPVNDLGLVDPAPPVLVPVSPPESSAKKRRGRPRLSVSSCKEESSLDLSPKHDGSPSILNLLPGKRGPGRPKKTPPVLEPNPPLLLPAKNSSDDPSLSLVLNEICERVKQRLDLPASKTSRGIELKELERIINDHKSTKARNSKIDAIFSKSKKLSKLPNIAIVKPMQHHILNERNDDDDRQHKKNGKKNKEKTEDHLASKLEEKLCGNIDDIEKPSRERRKSERDRKPLQKGSLSINNRAGRPVTHRARTRQISSGTDVSCDKSIDSDIRIAKLEKSEETKRNASVASDTSSTTAPNSSAFSPIQPFKKTPQKKKAKFLSLNHSLMHHKHKKKKNKKLKKNEKENIAKALFIKELEKVIADFQRVTLDGKKILPTAPIAPTPLATSAVVPAEPASASPLPKSAPTLTPMVVPAAPSEPRGKRMTKKRKGSERSRGSDRESATEKSKQSDRESSTEDSARDKEKEKPKRKQKKGHEVVKDLSEASPNEQRLPLKKRQYHITPANQNGENVEHSKDESEENVNERLHAKDNSVRKDAEKTKDSAAKRETVTRDGKEVRESKEREGQSRVLRSSVEDTIEATINRFSSTSPTPAALESGQRTVIVTPKKRHRVEEDSKDEKALLPQHKVKDGKPSAGVPNVKASGNKSASSARPAGSLVADKGGGKSSALGAGREGVIKSIGNIEPKRRSSSRSSSLNKDAVVEKLSGEGKPDKGKRAVAKTDSKSKVAIASEKRQTRSANKPSESDDSSKTEPIHIEVPSIAIDADKVEDVSNTAKVTETVASAATKTDTKAGKQPPAGIFEPSVDEVEIDSSILVPLNSPSELKNDLIGTLSVKKIKLAHTKKSPIHKLDSKSTSVNKKKKAEILLVKSMVETSTEPVIAPDPSTAPNLSPAVATTSVPTPLTTAEFILRTAEMKKKARRRKFINKTGFPNARKKKKKGKMLVESKTVDGAVIILNDSGNNFVQNSACASGIVVKEVENNDFIKSEETTIAKSSIDFSTKTKSFDDETGDGSSAETDDDIPLKKIVPKISHQIEEKLNAGRMFVKRALKRYASSSTAPDAKRRKTERTLRPAKVEEDSKTERTLRPAKVEDDSKSARSLRNTKDKVESKIERTLRPAKVDDESKLDRSLRPTKVEEDSKTDRSLRPSKVHEDIQIESSPTIKEDTSIIAANTAGETSQSLAGSAPGFAPIRKRKSSSTIKNTKSKMKSRYQLPLLSMKKFKKAKVEENPPSDGESEVTETKRKTQPRWRKKYLTAGLLSDHYKVERSEKSTKPVSEKSLSKWVYNPKEHPLGLLPPPAYCEKFVRRRRQDFRLPYDLWWLHANNQLPGREVVPSWNYRKIRTNIYYDVKPQTDGRNEAQSCNCKPPRSAQELGCGDDCINRMVFSECSPQLCPCEDRCSNQRIQRHEYAPGVERFMTKEKGWGVRTTQPIKSGEFILEYVGEVVSEKEFKERMQSRYVNDTHHYCLHLDGGLVIDGHRMGGDGRFVNHSCEPNCEMQKWTVNGLFRMALFALRNIPMHQELSYDYNFSLFDPAEGQVCLCGAKTCRGVIGGKSQRVSFPGGALQAQKPVLRDKKTGRGRKAAKARRRNDKGRTQMQTTAVKASTKPMSHQQRCFAQMHRCFLLRNIEKVRRGRDCGKMGSQQAGESRGAGGSGDVKPADVFYTQLNALSTLRSIKTRRLAQAEDNPQLAKVAKLAQVFKHLHSAIVSAKDEKGEFLAVPFTTLPTKKKQPQYYTKVTDPIDLSMVEQNINSGKYATIEAFDADVNRVFGNNVRYYGRTTELGIAATRLKRCYNLSKLHVVPQLEEILGDSLPASFLPEKTDPGGEEEDVIRCICGLYKDEGVMIQCERCLVWQHCDCVKADDSLEHYMCERCEPREFNPEILMEPPPEYAQEGQTHYVTLMRGTLQLRLGDTVYVLRDMLEESVSSSSPPRKVTYKTAKNVDYADLDIFRIERLWIDDKGGKFAFGHHYLRPHETYHEPSRKFFVNEVMRVPLYEVVPLDLILQNCWVLDLGTFCKGRPVTAPEEHIYICEYRVDKSARLFHKIAKPYPICTKNYAFEKFDTKLRPVRTYTPHGPVPSRRRARSHTRSTNGDEARRVDSDEELPLARVRDHAHAAKRDMQRRRLNRILVNLLNRLPKQQPLDVTYLLDPGKRPRTKSNAKKPT